MNEIVISFTNTAYLFLSYSKCHSYQTKKYATDFFLVDSLKLKICEILSRMKDKVVYIVILLRQIINESKCSKTGPSTRSKTCERFCSGTKNS